MTRSLGFSRGVLALVLLLLLSTPGHAATPSARAADAALDRALRELVAVPSGPPGVIAIVQRGRSRKVHAHGIRDIGQAEPPRASDFDEGSADAEHPDWELAVFEALHVAGERAVCAALARN